MNDNKIIAEFMGLSIKEGVSYYTDQDDMFFMNIEVEEPYLPFDEDWNWLIAVVSKCREESNAEDSHWEAIHYSLECCDIDVTHHAVVEFIKQYNKENN